MMLLARALARSLACAFARYLAWSLGRLVAYSIITLLPCACCVPPTFFSNAFPADKVKEGTIVTVARKGSAAQEGDRFETLHDFLKAWEDRTKVCGTRVGNYGVVLWRGTRVWY